MANEILVPGYYYNDGKKVVLVEEVTSVPSGNAGGDLSGTFPDPEVSDLTIFDQEQGSILFYNGTNWVHLAPSIDGYVLNTHSTGSNPTWELAAPSGSAGGDLSGTYPNPTVSDLTIASEQQGSLLYNNGSAWTQLSPGSDGYYLTINSNTPAWSKPLDVIQNVEFSNHLDRILDSEPYSAEEYGKIARVNSDNTLWQLVSTTPLWEMIGSTVVSRSDGYVSNSGGTQVLSFSLEDNFTYDLKITVRASDGSNGVEYIDGYSVLSHAYSGAANIDLQYQLFANSAADWITVIDTNSNNIRATITNNTANTRYVVAYIEVLVINNLP